MIHMKCQLCFLWKIKKKLSSAAVVIGALRVKKQTFLDFGAFISVAPFFLFSLVLEDIALHDWSIIDMPLNL